MVATNDSPINYKRNLQTEPGGDHKVPCALRLGARVILLSRVVVGREVVPGAGTVVTRDVSEFKVAVGVQVQMIGDVPEVEKLKDTTQFPYR